MPPARGPLLDYELRLALTLSSGQLRFGVMGKLLSRRRFLATSALSGAGIVALLWPAQTAGAFAIRKMDAETHALYLSSCGGAGAKAYHAKLLEQAKARLAGSLTDQQIEAALAQLTCPICGCPLIG
jgi:hypothetical protein